LRNVLFPELMEDGEVIRGVWVRQKKINYLRVTRRTNIIVSLRRLPRKGGIVAIFKPRKKTDCLWGEALSLKRGATGAKSWEDKGKSGDGNRKKGFTSRRSPSIFRDENARRPNKSRGEELALLIP